MDCVEPIYPPADKNRWYCLATLYGEQPADFCDELCEKNRVAWNRCMTNGLSALDRERLVANGFSADELVPLTEKEVSEFNDLFARRMGCARELPLLEEGIDFRNVRFGRFVDMSGFLFNGAVDFGSAAFSNAANFSSAAFLGEANFSSTTFGGEADFRSAAFSDYAIFSSATFSASSYFSAAKFEDCAIFNSVQFLGLAIFNFASFNAVANFKSAIFMDTSFFESAKFSEDVYFDLANFHAESDFSSSIFFASAQFASVTFSSSTSFKSANLKGDTGFTLAKFADITDFTSSKFSGEAQFDFATFPDAAYFNTVIFSKGVSFLGVKFFGRTTFVSAVFAKRVPDFRGASLHEATEWDDVSWPLPVNNKCEARRQVYGYQRLKQEMERLKKNEDELLFFCKELRSTRGVLRVLSPEWCLNALYDLSSSYGQSLARPLSWLAALYGLFVVLFATTSVNENPHPWRDAASLSFANVFAFLSIRKDLSDGSRATTFSSLTFYASAVEMIAAAVLLFLFVLALRNRFRIK